jgi:SpoVK/Ycf46/Vps4 family AAA+-type ATPase
LGKVRDDPSDHGELRRIVNAVLQFIDKYDGPSILVAATNHEHVLDNALWRRFAEVLEVPLPDHRMREDLLARLLMGRVDPTADISEVARTLDGYPHAAVERTAQDARRLALLDGRTRVSAADLIDATHRAKQRRWV